MENNPVRFEKREEGFGAVFIIETEDFRVCSEDEAKEHYDSLIGKRTNALNEIDSLEDQVDKFDKELEVFGDIFEEKEEDPVEPAEEEVLE